VHDAWNAAYRALPPSSLCVNVRGAGGGCPGGPGALFPPMRRSNPLLRERCEQALPQTPWATQYDALMRPWSPFADVPEVPVVRPRTAMLLMRKMLLSNPAAGGGD
jgi:hypothetical protein